MMPLNPYIAGNPVGGTPNFVGRADVLRELGYTVEWHEYELGHEASIDEIAALGRFIARVLAS